MTDLSFSELVEQLTAILDEALEHPPKPWSYFADSSPDAGYFGVLAKLSASEAGQAVSGTSIAAQVSHVIFSMEVSSAFIRGDLNPPGQKRWQHSWQVPELDEVMWTQMQQELRDAYHELRCTIESHAVSQAQSVGGAIGAIAHIAYHLGAIKQKIAALGRVV